MMPRKKLEGAGVPGVAGVVLFLGLVLMSVCGGLLVIDEEHFTRSVDVMGLSSGYAMSVWCG
jgi:hypothetical protein